MFKWNLMSFIYIWNLTLLILQAREIELNLGHCPIDQNQFICVTCCKKINRGPNLKAAASGHNDSCDARCQCNSLSTARSRHARSLNKEIHWFCPWHSNGKAKVITQTQTTVALSAPPEREKLQPWGKHAWYVTKSFKLDMMPLLTIALFYLVVKSAISLPRAVVSVNLAEKSGIVS